MKEDVSLAAVRSHLKLCHKLLQHRLISIEHQPKGMVLRNNQIKHTQTMLGLLAVLRGMVAHDPLDWWEDHDDVPF